MRVLNVLWCTIFSMNVFADNGYIEPVTDRIAKEECNACHFAFPDDASAGLVEENIGKFREPFW